MCRWMGSNCFTTPVHDWIDYHDGVAFVQELLEWCRTFSGFQGSENSGMKGFKKQKTFSWINASLLFRVTKLKGFITGRCINRKWQGWDCKNHFFRYIIGHRIDYNRELVLRGQRHTGLIGFLKRDCHITCLSKECRKNKNRTTIKKVTVQIKKKIINMEKELVSETGNQFQIFGPR